jgi:hypothetical protein
MSIFTNVHLINFFSKIEIGERPAEKDHTEEIDRQRCESYS